MGDDAHARELCIFFEIGFAIFKELHVAMEFVDDESLKARLVACSDDFKSTHDGSNHAAPVNIADEKCRNVNGLGKAHVGEITLAQVYFGWATSALDDDEVSLLGEYLVALHYRRHELLAILEKVAGRHCRGAPALNNDLGTRCGFRFQENRVHVDGCGLPRGAGLQGLGPADFTAITGDCGIV
jgi:hypothetical protein